MATQRPVRIVVGRPSPAAAAPARLVAIAPPSLQRQLCNSLPSRSTPMSSVARSKRRCATNLLTLHARLLPNANRRNPKMLQRPAPSQLQLDRCAAAHVLYRDYETRSVLSLGKVGVHRYVADSKTEVLCCAYAVDDEPVKLWTPGDVI